MPDYRCEEDWGGLCRQPIRVENRAPHVGPLEVRLGGQACGVSESFGLWGLAWIVRSPRGLAPHCGLGCGLKYSFDWARSHKTDSIEPSHTFQRCLRHPRSQPQLAAGVAQFDL